MTTKPRFSIFLFDKTQRNDKHHPTMSTTTTDSLDRIRQRQQEIAAERERQEQDKLERERPLVEAFAPIREFLEPLKMLHGDQFVTGVNPILYLDRTSVVLQRPSQDEISFQAELWSGSLVIWQGNTLRGPRIHRYTTIGSVLNYITDFFARQLKPL